MKMYRKKISITTGKRKEIIDITSEIERIVKESKIKEGLCNIYLPHATAGLIINENADPQLSIDILESLERSFPDNQGYRHDRIDNNAGAHIKSSIIGCSLTIPVINNSLGLGTWQGILLVELDGPRERYIVVSVY